jgi:hypothetical protein
MLINMEKEPNNSHCKYTLSLDELLDNMQSHPDSYEYLQVILSRKINHSLGLGQEYLVVSSDCFGVYRLNDVKYNDGVIQMVFTNKTNGNWAQICMDINDKHPKYFLVC